MRLVLLLIHLDLGLEKGLRSINLDAIRNKGLRYWFSALITVLLGLLGAHYLADVEVLVEARARVYQYIQEISPHSATHSRRTVLVLIDDKDYWRGDLARRKPLKKTYLAELLRKLDAANPAVIGVDIDLKAQTPDGFPLFHADYRDEIRYFLDAIRDVSNNRHVVLTRNISIDKNEVVSIVPSIYGEPGGIGPKVSAGFVELPSDILRIPLSVKLKNGSVLDSFAAALVRCVDDETISEISESGGELPYGGFMRAKRFKKLSAGEAMGINVESLKKKIEHQIVIIGGDWHEDSFGSGKLVDAWPTPVGHLSGPFVHGNYVEALLYGRIYKPWREMIAVTADVMLSIAVLGVFILAESSRRKLLYLSLIAVALIALAVFSLQNLGHFFDFFLPLVLLAAHSLVERILEWREAFVGKSHSEGFK